MAGSITKDWSTNAISANVNEINRVEFGINAKSPAVNLVVI